MIEAPGEQGGLYRSDDSGATWRMVNNAANLRVASVLLQLRRRQSRRTPTRSGSTRSGCSSPPTAASRSRPSRRRTATTTASGSTPTIPLTAIQCNDGGANVTRDGGRTWSSILNQPTGEFYMVSVDEQHPYLLYGPQQDNSTVVRAERSATCRSASITRRRRGRRHPAARPAASGRRPTAK